jgi:hypothetical protein
LLSAQLILCSPALLLHGPVAYSALSLANPRVPAHFSLARSPAFGSPPAAYAAHSASFSPRLAARWDPVVITFAAPEPAARPHRAGPRAAPWLCVAPTPSSLGPHAVSAALGLFSRRRRSSLGFSPYLQQPRAAAASNSRLSPPASILLGRRLSFVVEQCRSFAWR